MRFGKGIILVVGGRLSFSPSSLFLSVFSTSSLLTPLCSFVSFFIAWRVLAERSYLRISWILHALYNYSCVEIQNARLIRDGDRRGGAPLAGENDSAISPPPIKCFSFLDRILFPQSCAFRWLMKIGPAITTENRIYAWHSFHFKHCRNNDRVDQISIS